MTGKQVLAVVSFALIIGVSYATKDYLEECSALAQLGNLFTSDKNDSPEACNTDKGLVCVIGKCQCTPPNVYEKGIFFGVFGGGRCLWAANSPCFDKDAACVANSVCTSDSAGICSCKDGYHSKDGHCTSGANSKTIITTTPLYLLALVLSYVVLGQ